MSKGQAKSSVQKAQAGEEKVQVKRVQPYPINAVLSVQAEVGTSGIKCKIVKLVESGFLCRSENPNFIVGTNYYAGFELPVSHIRFKEQVKVIKTYDGIITDQNKTNAKQYLVEFHFLSITSDVKEKIRRFCRGIGQTSV